MGGACLQPTKQSANLVSFDEAVAVEVEQLEGEPQRVVALAALEEPFLLEATGRQSRSH